MAAHRSMRSALLPTQRFSSARARPQGWQCRAAERQQWRQAPQGGATSVPYAAAGLDANGPTQTQQANAAASARRLGRVRDESRRQRELASCKTLAKQRFLHSVRQR